MAIHCNQGTGVASLPDLDHPILAAAGDQAVLEPTEEGLHDELALAEAALLAQDGLILDGPHVDLADRLLQECKQMFSISREVNRNHQSTLLDALFLEFFFCLVQ